MFPQGVSKGAGVTEGVGHLSPDCLQWRAAGWHIGDQDLFFLLCMYLFFLQIDQDSSIWPWNGSVLAVSLVFCPVHAEIPLVLQFWIGISRLKQHTTNKGFIYFTRKTCLFRWRLARITMRTHNTKYCKSHYYYYYKCVGSIWGSIPSACDWKSSWVKFTNLAINSPAAPPSKIQPVHKM